MNVGHVLLLPGMGNQMNITTNLMRCWLRATREHRVSGAQWYRSAAGSVAALATRHGKSRAVVAGVVAATSPRLHWSRNLAVSDILLAGGAPSGVFRASLDKARRIMAGAKPLTVLGGNKVRAFYRALLGDRTAAVIDVWMLRACGLADTTRLDRNDMYRKCTEALTKVARRVGTSVTDLQATLWVAARGCAT